MMASQPSLVNRLGRGETSSPEHIDAALLNAARLLALSVNTCDPEPLIEKLGAEVTFETQSFFEVWSGRNEVTKYLRDKLAAVKNGGFPPNAEVGRIGNNSFGGDPGIIIRQEGVVRIFWVPGLDVEGKISSIFGCTVAPWPGTARGLGETPGLDEDDFQRREAERIDGHRKWVESLDGPIEFVAFILLSKTKQQWETRLIAAAEKYPDAKFRVVIHNLSSPDTEITALVHSEAQEYDLLGYPAIAVVKDGQIIRNAQGSNGLDEIMLELENMGVHQSSKN